MVCQQTCKSSHKNGLRLATDVWQDSFHTFITQVTTDNIVLWVTRHSIVDWVYSKTQIFLATLGGILRIFGSHTFVPIRWMCKKQTSVSHSSTESGIISLDAGLRMDGQLAPDLWDAAIEVLRSSKSTESPTHQAAGNCSRNHKSKHKRTQDVDQLSLVDDVTTNANSSQGESYLLYVFEDNEAVIKMIIKGRSPTMRHVSRSHRVALDLLFDRINVDPKIQIRHVDTRNQLADMLHT